MAGQWSNLFVRALRRRSLVDLLDTVAVNTPNYFELEDYHGAPPKVCAARKRLLNDLHAAKDLREAQVVLQAFIDLCDECEQEPPK